jgi:hypothetical protein
MSIDIRRLNATTKKKIKKIKDRIDTLYRGVKKELVVPMKVHFVASWTEGTDCYVSLEPDVGSKLLISAQRKYRKEINKEIKEIISFSDNLAKQLGYDKQEFWDVVFLNVSEKQKVGDLLKLKLNQG